MVSAAGILTTMNMVVRQNNSNPMKCIYEEPQIEILYIKVEQGFAQSNGVEMDVNGWGTEDFGGTAE